MNSRRPHRTIRRGIAATEAAFCLPIVLLLMFGTLGVCNALFLKETITIAAYEGARAGVKKNATAATVTTTVQSVLSARGLTQRTAGDFEITVTPSSLSSLKALDPVTVTVNVPVSGYVPFVGNFFRSTRVGASVTMVREFDQ